MAVERCPHCGGLITVELRTVTIDSTARAVTRQVTSRPAPSLAVGDRVRVTQHTRPDVEGQIAIVTRVFRQSVHVTIPSLPPPLEIGYWGLHTWQVEKVADAT